MNTGYQKRDVEKPKAALAEARNVEDAIARIRAILHPFQYVDRVQIMQDVMIALGLDTIEAGESSVEKVTTEYAEKYPPQRSETGNLVHVYRDEDGSWRVWLNTDIQCFDGLCIGSGATREQALCEADLVLDAAKKSLRAMW